MIPSPAMNQPEDILQMIFGELYPPLCVPVPLQSYSRASSICRRPHRVLSVISICRSWYFAGLRTLYRDIRITHVDQIPALLHTLHKPDTIFKYWVQSIDLYVAYPGHYNDFQAKFIHPFSQLLHMCPNLKTSVFNGYSAPPSFQDPFMFQHSIVTPPCSLTHVSIPSVLHYLGFLNTLTHMSHTLISLDIGEFDRASMEMVTRNPDRLAAHGTRTFPQLNTLSVPSIAYVLKGVQAWEMPHLERLILQDPVRCASEKEYNIYKRFFLKFGHGIKVLDIYPFPTYNPRPVPKSWYGDLLGWVPALEHLIVYHKCDEEWPDLEDTQLHANVKWIDVCEVEETTFTNWPNPEPFDDLYSALGYFIPRTSHNSQTETPSSESPIVRFPSLLGLRVFTSRVYDRNDLPHILLPWPTQGPEKIQYYPSIDFEPKLDPADHIRT